jgi:cytochrome c
MKKAFVIFSSALFIMACGSSGDTKPGKTDTAAAGGTASATVNPSAEKALELIAASDCHTCHKLNKDDAAGGPIGPNYADVAAKYSPAADTTVNRLVKKIINGGTGVWGSLPMTAHQTMKEDDVKTIVTYILSLKK